MCLVHIPSKQKEDQGCLCIVWVGFDFTQSQEQSNLWLFLQLSPCGTTSNDCTNCWPSDDWNSFHFLSFLLLWRFTIIPTVQFYFCSSWFSECLKSRGKQFFNHLATIKCAFQFSDNVEGGFKYRANTKHGIPYWMSQFHPLSLNNLEETWCHCLLRDKWKGVWV